MEQSRTEASRDGRGGSEWKERPIPEGNGPNLIIFFFKKKKGLGFTSPGGGGALCLNYMEREDCWRRKRCERHQSSTRTNMELFFSPQLARNDGEATRGGIGTEGILVLESYGTYGTRACMYLPPKRKRRRLRDGRWDGSMHGQLVEPGRRDHHFAAPAGYGNALLCTIMNSDSLDNGCYPIVAIEGALSVPSAH